MIHPSIAIWCWMRTRIGKMNAAPERIYLDNNATTPAASAVVEALLPWMREHCGNPSSLHAAGSESAEAVSAKQWPAGAMSGMLGVGEVVSAAAI